MNLYGYVGNKGIGDIDADGRKIYTSGDAAYRTKVKDSLVKLTSSDIEWKLESGDNYVLCQTKEGSSNIASTLTSGVTGSVKIVLKNEGATNGAWSDMTGDPRNVKINANAKVLLHIIEPTTTDGVYRHVKFYAQKEVSWEAMLWHELAGHAILGLNHPTDDWNHWNKGFSSTPPAGYGTREDPTITEENKARAVLVETARAPFYWGWETPSLPK